MKDFKFLKIAVYVPISHADAVRAAFSSAGAGKMGEYECCSFSTRGIGRFRAMEGAQPFVGEVGKLAEVEEEKIETICAAEKLEMVLEAVRKAHPYEEPAIDVYPLLNEL